MRRTVLLLAVSALCSIAAPAVAADEAPTGQIAYDDASQGTIHVVDADGSHDRILVTRAADPAWSPDGSKLAFTSSGSYFAEEVVYSDGFEQAIQLEPPLAVPQGRVSWSPDGTHFVLAACPDRTCAESHLYVADADGSHVRQITSDGEDRDPSWSPDGSWIAFTRVVGAVSAIDMVHPDGTGLRPMLPYAPQVFAFGPAWSPDGQQIAFSSRTSTGIGIFVADLPTELQRQITFGPFDAGASWSPDGRYIVFGTGTGRANEIDIVGADGTHRRPLVVSGGSGTSIAPDWRPYAPALRLLSHGVSPLVARRAFTVVATVTATGAAPMSSVSVSAIVRGRARVLSLAPSGHACESGYRGSLRATCALGDLAPGAFVVLRLRVEPLRLGSLEVHLSTTSLSPELDRTDNSVVLRTRVVRAI